MPGPGAARRALGALARLALVYFLLAYLLLPQAWRRYTRRHPNLEAVPRVTRTAADISGDPLNVGLIGGEQDVIRAMTSARWYPADRITLWSSLRISASAVLNRPYATAPVSSLFLWGRKQDLAFEQPVGTSARKRHHVRFWCAPATDDDGQPVWVGAATFDERVGLSHTTGQVTHHVDADIDRERDKVMRDLKQRGRLAEIYYVNFHTKLEGRNGGGDRYRTDGRLAVGVLQGNKP